MKFVLVIFLITTCCIYDISGSKEWWEVSAFYQIYPRSFKDSNGDGVGDLRGVIEKLPYLKDLGINATWLSPIFKSPMADFGYDISSFFEIQPEYGTMDDFEELVKRAHELGIRVILDFVPNHSSDENEWFIKSENREPGYENFYVWHDGYQNSSGRQPPSNWLSFFRGSAWQWSEKRQQFYLHQFHRKQPDLNYRDPFVVASMKQVLWYWLEKGVDGFRCDIVPAVFEIKPDDNGRFPDEPKSGFTNDPEDPSSLSHIYTQDQPETLDMVYQWRNLLDVFQELHGGERRVLLTESYSELDTVMKYYGDDVNHRNGSNIPFNFQFITNLKNSSTANEIQTIIDSWMNRIPNNRTPNWVIGNHDQRRVGSRLGQNRIDSIAMIQFTLPGVSVTYNGEEIGMTDVWISWEDTVDPQACQSNPQIFDNLSRDPARTPFQWSNGTSAGFSTSTSTWLPVSPNYREVNVEAELAATKSHLKNYKRLIELRQSETMQYGNFESMVLFSEIVLIKREISGKSAYITVVNWGSSTKAVQINSVIRNIPETLTYEVVSVNSKHSPGDTVRPEDVTLQPYESFILKMN